MAEIDKSVVETYYFKFFRSNRTFIGVVSADCIKLSEVDQTHIMYIPVRISPSIIEELVYEGIHADYLEDDPDYVYLGTIIKSSTSERHYDFTPELKYNIATGIITYIEEEDRIVTKQVIG